MLLRLSGRIPDGLISEVRDRLVAEDLQSLARTVSLAVVERGVPLTGHDADLLGSLLTGSGLDAGPLTRVPRQTEEPVPTWDFAPAPLSALRTGQDRIGRCLDLTDDQDRVISDQLLDERDQAMIELLAGRPGCLGLWRAWRFPGVGSPRSSARRIYLVEVTPRTDPSVLALRVQVELSERGEIHPQVETYVSGSPLPLYQRTARDWSSLLWAPDPPRPIRRAAVYDAVDAETGPRFDPGHPLLTDATLRERLTGYLMSATLIRANGIRRDDILDRSRHAVVPWNFRTDGAWIWSEALPYYLREHGLAPTGDFLDHLRATRSRPPVLDSVTTFRARATLCRKRPPTA
ncbi:hypothetical protein ACQP2T_50360 [Nonomuraea sp. CA-143628]|uniref:hypothetical protein n=1 Tax=Nonomuraea sp. CA-143628 TaxID=3239997 RepID=UPI003D8E1DCD